MTQDSEQEAFEAKYGKAEYSTPIMKEMLREVFYEGYFAAKASAEAVGWMPIESAPKEERVIVYCPVWGMLEKLNSIKQIEHGSGAMNPVLTIFYTRLYGNPFRPRHAITMERCDVR